MNGKKNLMNKLTEEEIQRRKENKINPFDIIGNMIRGVIILNEDPIYEKRNWYYKVQCLNCKEIFYVVRGSLLEKNKDRSNLCQKCFKGKPKDNLIGKKIGLLTVISQANKINGRIAWNCKCDCGNEIDLTQHEMFDKRRKSILSCGCQNPYKKKIKSIKEKIGTIHNDWKILKLEYEKHGKKYFLSECQCCGERKIIKENSFSFNMCKERRENFNKQLQEIKLKKEIIETPQNIKDLTNQKFYRLKVLGFAGIVRYKKYWVCQCDCGNIIVVPQSELEKGRVKSCGCLVSFGEETISNFLNKNNIKFVQQKSFKDCKFKKVLKFDFQIFYPGSKKFFLCEYQGQQHYNIVDFNENSTEKQKKKNLELNKKRDQIKRDYCMKNNIKLLEIPFWEFKNIEKILIKELKLNRQVNYEFTI